MNTLEGRKINDDCPEKRDIKNALECIQGQLTWCGNENILNFGDDCATTILNKFLSPYCAVINAEKPFEWSDTYTNCFNKIFSFHFLHMVKNQRRTAKIMNELLKENGQLVTLFHLSHPFFVLYKNIPEFTKWKNIIKPWRTWDVFCNHTCLDKKNEYLKILEENNFQVISSMVEEANFVHDSLDEFLAYFDKSNPFKSDVPKDKYRDFLEDCKDFLLLTCLLSLDNQGRTTFKYTNILTNARKKSLI